MQLCFVPAVGSAISNVCFCKVEHKYTKSSWKAWNHETMTTAYPPGEGGRGRRALARSVPQVHVWASSASKSMFELHKLLYSHSSSVTRHFFIPPLAWSQPEDPKLCRDVEDKMSTLGRSSTTRHTYTGTVYWGERIHSTAKAYKAFLRREVEEFLRNIDKLSPPEIVVIFFAGHGLQEGDKIYFFSSDCRPWR